MNIEEKLNWLQPILVKQFTKTVQQKQLAHAYLFEGISGTGKKEMSLWLAASLLCQDGEANLPCEKCQNCKNFEQNLENYENFQNDQNDQKSAQNVKKMIFKKKLLRYSRLMLGKCIKICKKTGFIYTCIIFISLSLT